MSNTHSDCLSFDSLSSGTRADCPFCAGNELLTPPDIMRMPAASAQPWRARIIPNRFPIVEPRSPTQQTAELPPSIATPATRPAHGVHDVVIESPNHDHTILAITPSAWRDVWELCRQRIALLSEREDLLWATVFKNSGVHAGASLEHLHSQLIALDFIPPLLAAELEALAGTGNPFANVLTVARMTDTVVAEAGDLVAIVPPATRQPFEIWILPCHPEAYFHATSAAHIEALDSLTQRVVAKLQRLVPGADYNWWLHQAPFAKRTGSPEAARLSKWHWHLEILPRLASFAGFELATGCHVTTLFPQESARRLREA